MNKECARCGKHWDLTFIASPRGKLKPYYLCGDCIRLDTDEYGYEARAFLYRQELLRRRSERRAMKRAEQLQVFRNNQEVLHYGKEQ